jgi:acyl-CoA hydrolase
LVPKRHNRGVQPIPNKEAAWMTAEEAVTTIKSGMRVYIHSSAATPLALVEAMTQHGLTNKLSNIEVIHMQTEGKAEYAQPHCQGIFRSNSVFLGENCRAAVDEGRGDFIPVFLSEVPLLFRRGILPIDVALVTVSPPDKHGFCTLATSVDTALAAVQTAKYVIGQVNNCAPRTFGDGLIHVSQLDAVVSADVPLPEMDKAKRQPSAIEEKIGKVLADNLIDDGATLQLGIGRIPHAVLQKLKHRRDLGIHSEMISDAIVRLFTTGQCTNAHKTVQQGKIVGSFAYGTRDLYDFMNNNPCVWLGDASWVARTAFIAQNPKMTSINTCIEVDLTGQVCADSIGRSMYTGVGGQMDFMRGAALGHDGLGKAVIAISSLAPRGESKIVPFLKEAAGVVTTRAHVHYIVTEYGIANLFGKTLRQRAYELIRIAHPTKREWLEKAAFERLKVMPCL